MKNTVLFFCLWSMSALIGLLVFNRNSHADESSISIANQSLRVTLKMPLGVLDVQDTRSGLHWRQYVPIRIAQGREWGKVTTREIARHELLQISSAVTTENSIRCQAEWRTHPFEVVFELASNEPVLTVSIDMPDRDKKLPWKPGWAGVMLMTYPYAFYNDSASSDAVVPIDEGVLYSTREVSTAADPRRWRPWWLYQKLSMPWWGVTSGGAGVMTRVDTPFDCMFSIQWVETPSGVRTLPHVTWIGSKQRLDYARRVAYRFFTEGGHVAMAKAFRHSQQAADKFRSWEEKVAANPQVTKLKGALDLWSQTDVTAEMVKQIRAAGIRKAIIARSRRGDPDPGQGIEPEAIELANKAGYLIGGYHNYSWIQGKWIEHDPTLKDAAVMQADGKFKSIANAWDPKGRLDRCPAAHRLVFLENARKSRKLGINYFFTDCTTTGGSIKECFHPQHPLARREGPDRLNEALQGIVDLKLVVGSERGKWWATQTTDVFEGIETLIEYGGSYYGSGDASHWVGPYRTDKPGYRELFLGFDFNPARRVPLFQLVYHDSVYCTRRWNQDPGRAPELWTRHDLINILYGTAPIWFMHPQAGNVIGTPEWERVEDRYLESYRKVCGWHERVGFDEMVDHRFLTDDRLVQETRFSSGWVMVVNFSDRAWSDPRGFQVRPHDHSAWKRMIP